MKEGVTLVITSMDRMDLLEKTVESFFRHNTYPITKTLIIEDSGKELDFSGVEQHIVGDYEIIRNETNIGQWASIDKVYSMVETDWIFHCEEDWEFIDGGCIEDSMEVFESYDGKLFTVWACGRKIQKNPGRLLIGDRETKNGKTYRLIDRSIAMGGFTLNPGLRRTKDVMAAHPYRELEMGGDKDREWTLARLYRKWGYYSAWVVDSNYCVHLGYERHIERDLSR